VIGGLFSRHRKQAVAERDNARELWRRLSKECRRLRAGFVRMQLRAQGAEAAAGRAMREGLEALDALRSELAVERSKAAAVAEEAETIRAHLEWAELQYARVVDERDERERQHRAGTAWMHSYVDRVIAAEAAEGRAVEALKIAAPDRAAVLCELVAVQRKCKEQARQLTIMREVAEKRNRELDALHFVWCSGGCGKGAHRYSPDTVTRDVVMEAIRNTRRLVTHYVNKAHREGAVETDLLSVFFRGGESASTLAGVVALESRVVQAEADRDAALEQLAAAREALVRYGVHAPRCGAGSTDISDERCTCGLRVAAPKKRKRYE